MKKWEKIFAIDYRSVALFRMGTALCLIWDSLERLQDAQDFLTNAGLFPLSVYHHYRMNNPVFSIYGWSDRNLWPIFLLFVTIALGVLLVFGIFPRLLALLLWFLNVSLHQRNPHVLFGGDLLLQTCLFWLVFIPSRPQQKAQKNFCNGVSFAVIIQITLIYIMAGWQKTGSDWHDGTASFYAVSIGMYQTMAGAWLRKWPLLLKIATYFTLNLERWGAALFFLPSENSWTRTLAFILLAGMHLIFATALRLYYFPWLDIALLCLLIPTDLWEKLKWNPRIGYSRFAHAHWISASALIFIVWITLLNLQAVGAVTLPSKLDVLARMSRMRQTWALFSPSPFHFSSWVVFEAERTDGKKQIIKIHGFGANSFSRPDFIGDTYPTLDWLRFSPVLVSAQNLPGAIRGFGKFVCRVANEENKQAVKRFSVYIVRDITKLDPYKAPEIHVDRVIGGDCRNDDFSSFAINWSE